MTVVDFTPSSRREPDPAGVYVTRGFVKQTGKLGRVKCDRCGEQGRHVCMPRALHAVAVIEQVLPHTKGRWARQPFILDAWQRDDLIIPIFGTVEWSPEFERWIRTYRIVWLEVPRKNGKSEICAAIALVLLAADGEEGAEIYGAALDTKQARKVFDVAARMVTLSPPLGKRLRVYTASKRIVFERTGSVYEVVPADAAGNLGHNPHGGVIDEAQEQADGGLYDAIRQGMGTREQPLIVCALTAGNRPTSWAKGEHDYSLKVAAKPSLDPRRFVYVRGVPSDADWSDERLWHQANPALGSFLSLQALRDEAVEAKANLRKQNAFRQFRLNQWVSQATRWLELDQWDATAGLVVEHELRHRYAFGGLDLSSTADLTALAWAFPPDGYKAEPPGGDGDELELPAEPFTFVWRYWIPEAAVEQLNARTYGLADEWIKDGYIDVTEGNVLDYDAVRRRMLQDRDLFDVRIVGYDPWNATEFVEQRLGERDGFKVLPVRQGYATMSPPAKEWERLVLGGRVKHGGNPVTRWMIDNVVVTRDPSGNIKPDKSKSGEKIDGVVAAINGLYCAMREPAPKRSAYRERGVIVA